MKQTIVILFSLLFPFILCGQTPAFPGAEGGGKYTTGGSRRTRECPRYTQVGNAVPPLLAEAVGRAIYRMIADINRVPSITKYKGE